MYDKEYHKKYYNENKEKIVAYSKKYRELNPDYHSDYGYYYYHANREKLYKNRMDKLREEKKD
jgi:hypothetical protein